MEKEMLKNEYFGEKTKEDVFRRWNKHLALNEKDGYNNYHEYKIHERKTNDKFSSYVLSEDYYGYDVEFAFFDKKDNLIFTTNDEMKVYFFDQYGLDPNIHKDEFNNYIKQIEDEREEEFSR
ncbi:hypothetical protein [Spiroplasma chrysopicola]|uniref:Uncharacterized protein n=1 Tax=Spiroplasma chrysopicola DF-1 TaxID=1276227 RepID=R4U2A5_9MOLU|nr:hypothetical protein [Spiroplasma chrysopicola]AGM25487.1 hypothetical protein SCHRY_v1c09140 [Spiroplasma chrysopicola DF-1]